MTFPAPVINVAIEPRTKGDQDKLGIAIQRLAEEDPTFQVRTDEETGQTIISGMGELHLEVLVERMRREFRVEANNRPAAGRLPGDHPGKAEKSSTRTRSRPAAAGQYAKVVINLDRPAATAGGYEFENKIHGGKVPREYIPSVDAGWPGGGRVRRAAGYPMVDLKVT